jgi:hypothetical protein
MNCSNSADGFPHRADESYDHKGRGRRIAAGKCHSIYRVWGSKSRPSGNQRSLVKRETPASVGHFTGHADSTPPGAIAGLVQFWFRGQALRAVLVDGSTCFRYLADGGSPILERRVCTLEHGDRPADNNTEVPIQPTLMASVSIQPTAIPVHLGAGDALELSWQKR